MKKAELIEALKTEKETVRKLKQELSTSHDELAQTNSELLQLTLELDDRVAERTKALEESERELRIHRDHLQDLVDERTRDIKDLNRQIAGQLFDLQKSEERFRGLVETIPDMVYHIDQNGYFLLINDAVRRLGFEKNELIGRHFSTIIYAPDLEQVSRSKVLKAYAGRTTGDGNSPKLFDERRSGQRKTAGLEVRLLTKEKTLVAGEIRSVTEETVVVEISSAGMYEIEPNTKERRFVGTVGVIRDITDRKRLEAELRQSEERFEMALEGGELGLWDWDMGGGKVIYNERWAEMLGYSLADISWDIATWRDRVHPDDIDATLAKIQAHTDGETPLYESAHRLRAKSGAWRWILGRGKVTERDQDGKPLRMIGTNLDITEQKTLEERLRISRDELEEKVKERTAELNDLLRQLKQSQSQLIQTEKIAALGTLTAGVAHELNNPMMGMLNFTQYCLKHTTRDDRRYEVLQDILTEIKRCIGIVNNLLTFSRAEQNGDDGYEKVHVAGVLDRVFKLLDYRISKDNITVTTDIAEDLPHIPIKPSNMQQVFLNLIGNGLDAVKGRERRELAVTLSCNGGYVHVVIADTGCGIESEILNKIFDPFFTTKPVGEGTGLGLSVSHGIVKDHGGEITCESEVGSGTTFTVKLPVGRVDG